MTNDSKREFLQKYLLDDYSKALPTRTLSGKSVTLGDYCDPVDSRKKRPSQNSDDEYDSDPDNRYALPEDAKKIPHKKEIPIPKEYDDEDVYELAKHPVEEYEVKKPSPKPSPKPRSVKRYSVETQPSQSLLEGKGDAAAVSYPNTASTTGFSTFGKAPGGSEEIKWTPSTKRPGKKVVEIDYEMTPGSSTELNSQTTAPSSSSPSHQPPQKPRSVRRYQDTAPTHQPPPPPQTSAPTTGLGGTEGPECVYEEPWDLKVKRLKQQQEQKGLGLIQTKTPDQIPGLTKMPSVSEDARVSPVQQRLGYERTQSQTSETDIFHDALDSLPGQMTGAVMSVAGQQTKQVIESSFHPPRDTYEDAWDLKNNILEQKIREMQVQASAVYEEPWDSSNQQRQLKAKFESSQSDTYQEPWDSSNQQKQLRAKFETGQSFSQEPGSGKQYSWQRSSSEDTPTQNGSKRAAVARTRYSIDETKNKGRSGTLGQKINPNIPLTSQNWYHGNITREEAEQMLCVCKEGSYIVRISSDRKSYSLSIKSSKQYIHVQIEQACQKDGSLHYILGKNSKEFSSIPDMIDYYTYHRVPLKGAEHIFLLHPVECKWS